MHIARFVVLVVCILLTSTELKKVRRLQSFNPGKCNQTNHGLLALVKNRQNDDKLLICVEENNGYIWKTTDGSNLTGEFFNPATDCSDIINKNANAKDGFYWIELSGSVPRKVWCDLTTDGGGFMLIGRKNNSVTWTVPSNSIPVEPFGEPHWSSSLGDAPIVDFRIQMATQENFTATMAHWSLRLKNKRPLKNLFIVNERGCGRLSPGIGDISFVKDLQTEEIVSKTFRCSHFGSYYPKSSKFGWDKMNYCLEQPCPLGFAFLPSHNKYQPHQISFSGAFSYSATGKTSGIIHNSTSFVGCDNQKCCGCFGPIGGKKNYCGTECTAIKGGTVVKNVYTWFWVRSSLPKRLWNKCMEYKVPSTKGKGKEIWYKLSNGNTVPVRGRCSQNEALLNDGIVVVPDSTASNKVPYFPGLLEYRKDNKKLYIRSNETWNVIGEEKKVLEKAEEQTELKLIGVQEKVLKKAAEQFKSKLDQLERKLLKKAAEQVKPKLDQLEQKVLKKAAEQFKPKLDQLEQRVLKKAAEKVKPKLDQLEQKMLKKAAEQAKPKMDQLEQKIMNQQNTKFAHINKSIAQLKSQLEHTDQNVIRKSCASFYKSGASKDGLYTINPDGLGSFQVRCDMTTDGGGWTVFQRRQDGSEDFFLGWSEYKAGFGDLDGEFWLGLDRIHRLTKSGQNVLRVDLMDFGKTRKYAKYGTFYVASESSRYKLSVGSFSGNTRDSLDYHNGMNFSTKDKDNDRWDSVNCAVSSKGAWWYNSCQHSNLNGLYLNQHEQSYLGIRWRNWKLNDNRSMKKVEMKIRPAQF